MDIAASRPVAFSADPSLIDSEFIRRLQEQRVVHSREAAFHLAEAEKHGAADEALVSMIHAAEKIVAIMFPGQPMAVAPVEAPAADLRDSPSLAEAAIAAAGHAPAFATHNAPPAANGQESLMSSDRTESSGNSWRMRLMRSSA